MAPQTYTYPVESPCTPESAPAPGFSYRWPPESPRPQRGLRFWALLVTSVLLGMASLGLLGYLLVGANRSIAPPPERRIAVPYADRPDVCGFFRSWVVQEDGRCKPLDTFCRESLLTITGRERFEGNDPVAIVLSWLLLFDPLRNQSNEAARAMGCDWDHYPFLLCEYPELREMLYREFHGADAELTAEQLHGKYIEPVVVRSSNRLNEMLQETAQRTEDNSKTEVTTLERRAQEVKKRLALYERIRGGGQEGTHRVHVPGELGVVALDTHGPTWFSLRSIHDLAEQPTRWQEMLHSRRLEQSQFYAGQPEQPYPAAAVQELATATRQLQSAYRSGDPAHFLIAGANCKEVITRVGRQAPQTAALPTGLELWFNRTTPFRQAWLCSLLAALFLAGSLVAGTRWPRVRHACYFAGLLGFVGSLAWSISGFYCRVAISGRPPVSNMYESIIWVAFMTALFGLLLEGIYRKGVIALAASLVSTLGLVLADQLPLTFAPAIQPLQAVLRSNYWLIIHVLTIVSSYAAFALAWGLGNFNLALLLWAPRRADLIRTLSHFCYRAIQIGVVLLAAGTFLGGFWAAESWGRFWGWDPKEVWALIALLCYLIPLHARYVGWVKDFGLALSAVICFAAVAMAWYGVNFILGAGLHSYGFGGGNDLWVYCAALCNLTLAVQASLRYLYHQPLPARELASA